MRSLIFKVSFLGGLLALGASTLKSDKSEHYMNLAKDLAHTCHESYDRTGMVILLVSFCLQYILSKNLVFQIRNWVQSLSDSWKV